MATEVHGAAASQELQTGANNTFDQPTSSTGPHIPGTRAFVLDNVLTPEECQVWIAQATSKGFVAKATDDLSHKEAASRLQMQQQSEFFYGDRERATMVDETWAGKIWAAIGEHVEAVHFHGPESPLNGYLRKTVFDGPAAKTLPPGVYEPHSVSPLMRVSRYAPGGIFKRHCDGMYARDEGYAGFYTVLVYLNDVGVEDGAASIGEAPVRNSAATRGPGGCTDLFDGSTGKKVWSVRPKAGRVLAFHLNQLHEGALLHEGVKYLVRTEVVFGRTGPLPSSKGTAVVGM